MAPIPASSCGRHPARFTGCADCPLIKQCRNPKTDPSHLRQVFISDHRDLLKAAKTYNQSDAGKTDLKQRPRVERFIANLVRYHDARQARRRGTVNADYQAKKAGTAFNLRQWLRLRRKRAEAARLAAATTSQAAPPNEVPDSATLSHPVLTVSC